MKNGFFFPRLCGLAVLMAGITGFAPDAFTQESASIDGFSLNGDGVEMTILTPSGKLGQIHLVRKDGQKSAVISDSAITLLPADAVTSAKVMSKSGSRIASVELSMKDGTAAMLTIRLVKDGAVLTLSGVANVPGQLNITASGADRTLYSTDGKVYINSIAQLKRGIMGECVALQNRSDQSGMIVKSISGGGLTISTAGGKTACSIGTGAKGKTATLAVEVKFFRGDAAIALENAAGKINQTASAQTTTALEITSAIPAKTASENSAAAAPSKTTNTEIQKQAICPGPIEETPWQFFADEARVFKPLLADPREATNRVSLSYGKNYGENSRACFEAQLGGDLGLLRKDFSQDEAFSVSVRFLFPSRFDFSRDVWTHLVSDFYVGIPFGYKKEKHSFELYVYHESSHLGDTALDDGVRERETYSRETLRFLYSYDILKNLRVYAGPSINFRAWPEGIRNKVILQAGAEYQWDVNLFGNRPMYAAIDLQSKEENNWYVNLAAQVGIELGNMNQKIIKRPRLFLEFFNGYSNMGQYWDTRETTVMLGMAFDF